MNEGALAGDHLKHIHALITIWSLVYFKDRGALSYAVTVRERATDPNLWAMKRSAPR